MSDTGVPEMDSAGINYSLTEPNSPYSMYQINGQNVYIPTGTGNQPGDLNPQAQSYLAQLSDPYLNPESRTSAPSEFYGGLNYTAAAGAGAAGSAGTAAAAGGTQEQRDAAALIRQALAQYGLPSTLGDWAWQEIVSGKSQNEVMLDLYQRPEFKNEFGAVMDGRQKAGLAPMSPGDIVSWRNTAQQMMRAAGLPPGLHDSKSDLDQNMVDNVSAQEFHDRVVGAADAMFRWDPNDIRALQDHGLSTGDLIGMWLNPDKAQPLIEKTVAAARIGGAAYRSGYGQVASDQADLYATQGVTQQQAQSGFTQLAHDQQLFNPLAGAGGSEDTITQADQLAAAFGGNNAQQRRIEQRRQQRQATFQDGGGFASSQTGMSGLGSSEQ